MTNVQMFALAAIVFLSPNLDRVSRVALGFGCVAIAFWFSRQ